MTFQHYAERRICLGGAILLTLICAGLFFAGTKFGIGIFPDSTRYMGISPKLYDAPLYAWILRLFPLMGIEIQVGAKLLGLVLLCTNILLSWRLFSLLTNRCWVALGGAIVLASSPHMIEVHLAALSEPLFLTFFLAIFIFLRSYLIRNLDVRWLLGCAVFVALATLTRFIGISIGSAIFCGVLSVPFAPRMTRIKHATVFALSSSLIFLLGVLGSRFLTGQITGREFGFYGRLSGQTAKDLLESVSGLVLPAELPWPIKLLAVVSIVTIVATWTVQHTMRSFEQAAQQREVSGTLTYFFGLFLVFYSACLAVALLVEANLDIKGRYVLPLYVGATFILATVLNSGLSVPSKAMQVVTATLLSVLVLYNSARTGTRVWIAHQQGQGYESPSWTQSPTMRAVKELPANATIYSNGADAISFVTSRASYFVPSLFNRRSGKDELGNPLSKQLGAMKESLNKGSTFVVYFDKIDTRFYLIQEQALAKSMQLQLQQLHSDGRIYCRCNILSMHGR